MEWRERKKKGKKKGFEFLRFGFFLLPSFDLQLSLSLSLSLSLPLLLLPPHLFLPELPVDLRDRARLQAAVEDRVELLGARRHRHEVRALLGDDRRRGEAHWAELPGCFFSCFRRFFSKEVSKREEAAECRREKEIEAFRGGERKEKERELKRKEEMKKLPLSLSLSLTFLLHLHHLRLGDALDQAELLLCGVCQGLDGVDAALFEALEVGRGDAELLFFRCCC